MNDCCRELLRVIEHLSARPNWVPGKTLDELKDEVIVTALRLYPTRDRAAEELGITRRTLTNRGHKKNSLKNREHT